MSNYNEAREIEKRALAAMVERSFYPEIAVSTPQASSIMEVLNQNPDLAGQILKNLLLQTAYAQPNTTVTGQPRLAGALADSAAPAADASD